MKSHTWLKKSDAKKHTKHLRKTYPKVTFRKTKKGYTTYRYR